MNILILSCGTRNKVVQYFKNTLKDKGKVIGTDCSNLAHLYPCFSSHLNILNLSRDISHKSYDDPITLTSKDLNLFSCFANNESSGSINDRTPI